MGAVELLPHPSDSSLGAVYMGRWPIKDVQCRDCGTTHQATRAMARCLACKRRLSSDMTLTRRRQAFQFVCRCGCGTPVKRDQYLRGHVPPKAYPCKCGCGQLMQSANRYMRGHRQAVIAKTLCGCGCGEPVSNLQNKFRWGHFSYPCIDCGATVTSANGYRRRCDTCAKVAEDARKKRPENRERHARWGRDNAPRVRAARHGLTVAEHDELYRRQRGRCAICQTPGPQHGRDKEALVVDHWHGHGCESGKTHCSDCIRGLLCGPCNTAIGIMRDDPMLMRKAARYLSAWRPPAA